MLETEVINKAQKLVQFINNKSFEPITQRTPYYHMGATITDAVLQAGLNYRHVVYPRVLKLLTDYSDYKTTCDFLILMQVVPLSQLINWGNEKKLHRVHDLSWFLYHKGIENETELAAWLNNSNHINELGLINGVGPKTIDYLKLLCGEQAIAIDRHLFSFLKLADILVESYQEASSVYQKASSMLGIDGYDLDRKIWFYMSKASS